MSEDAEVVETVAEVVETVRFALLSSGVECYGYDSVFAYIYRDAEQSFSYCRVPV
jgi:hypothetical protein